jgi:ABC-2 type transport system ATP-binding protein
VSVTRLVLALAKQNCEVLSLYERGESLESYFISLTGGGER